MLVSVGDRKARIELGGDWGRKRDDFCQQVMSGRMVPSFKEGDYAGGIANAVASLSEMAAAGPEGAAPAGSSAVGFDGAASSARPAR